MGSNYFGSEKSSSSSSSSRKNKKSSMTEKPKQPQRGLGVAQLEQIRLRTQTSCGFNTPILQEDVTRGQRVPPYGVVPIQSSTSSYPSYSQSSLSTSSTYAHQHNFMMTFEEQNLGCHDSQPSTTLGWNTDSVGLSDNSAFEQSGMPSRHLPYFQDERHSRIDLMRSRSQNSESSDHEDVDLELRLSL